MWTFCFTSSQLSARRHRVTLASQLTGLHVRYLFFCLFLEKEFKKMRFRLMGRVCLDPQHRGDVSPLRSFFAAFFAFFSLSLKS
jgi:hypothetical protein